MRRAPFPRALLLDLDGTLVDTLPDIAAAANAALAELGRAPLGPAVIRGLVGHGAGWLMRGCLAAASASGEIPAELALRATQAFRAHYRAQPAVHSRLYPGWPALLDELEEAGLRLAIVSNKPLELCRAALAHLGVERRFASVIGDGSCSARKPAAEPFELALRELGAAREQALVVGDGEPDLQGARAAGVFACAATWGYGEPRALARLAPDWTVGDVPALGRLLRELRAGEDPRLQSGSRAPAPPP